MRHPHLLILLLASLLAAPLHAQDASSSTLHEGTWRYAFSSAGRRQWTPEFTVRYSAGFVTEGPALTAGVRVDGKRTLGLWVGKGASWIDHAPAHIYAIQTAACMRRYVHLGSRDIVALYGEFLIGPEWVYDVTGALTFEYDDPATGQHIVEELLSDRAGDVNLYAGIHAGIRVRFLKNIHLFLGPTYTTNTIGLHLGLGF